MRACVPVPPVLWEGGCGGVRGRCGNCCLLLCGKLIGRMGAPRSFSLLMTLLSLLHGLAACPLRRRGLPL